METTHLGRHRRRDALDALFCQRVYAIVVQIPAGKVVTYGQIAALLGDPKGAQQVGAAMYLAPADLHLPCHRVVNKAGTLAPEYAFGGAEKQRALLEQEGVTFTANGCIDMPRHLWRLEVKPLSLQQEFQL